MTIMSRVSAQSFADELLTVLPEGKLLDPLDYVTAFNLQREVPLGKDTFKKYVSLVYKAGCAPSLRREKAASGKFQYFLEKPSKGLTPPVVGSPCVSDTALSAFVQRVQGVMKPRRWYTVATVRRYHNMKFSRPLKGRTFRYYMGLAFRRGLWDGLERRKERGMYKYKWGEGENASFTPVVEKQQGASLPSASSCVSCGGSSPVGANFCMHCGSALGTFIRVVVQEECFSAMIPAGDEITDAFVRELVCSRIRKGVVGSTSADDGAITFTVGGPRGSN
jgi:hypothetical protein